MRLRKLCSALALFLMAGCQSSASSTPSRDGPVAAATPAPAPQSASTTLGTSAPPSAPATAERVVPAAPDASAGAVISAREVLPRIEGKRFWWNPMKVDSSYDLLLCPGGRAIQTKNDKRTVGRYSVGSDGAVTVKAAKDTRVYKLSDDGTKLVSGTFVLVEQGPADCGG